MIDYSALDQPSLLRYVFYPRRDHSPCPNNAFDTSVPVDPDVWISCRFYAGDPLWPWILFFHGNGEVASDYDGIAPLYHQRGLNLVVAEYRGYGISGGTPTLSDLVKDSDVTFAEVRKTLSARNLRSALWVMGRSLGSVPALHLAYTYQEVIPGFIVESGCLSVTRVIRDLGIPADGVNLERVDHECLEMVKKIRNPALIIHGAQDSLIPVREAEDLYRNLGSDQKEMVLIPSAGHNDIMSVGFERYFESLQQFVGKKRMAVSIAS
jgi:uncharacterized protein